MLSILGLPNENENHQGVSCESKEHHDEINCCEDIMSGWRLWWKLKPMRVDFLQKAFGYAAFKIPESRNITVGSKKQLFAMKTLSNVYKVYNFNKFESFCIFPDDIWDSNSLKFESLFMKIQLNQHSLWFLFSLAHFHVADFRFLFVSR